jgi:hypothetical protein
MIMKKLILTLSIFSAAGLTMAQAPDDALRLSLNRPIGTARSLSLSNAVGALGGDYTSIGINPAGVAVYRSSEFTFTPSLTINNTNSNYYGYSADDDKISFPLQQIGFVGTYRPMREVTSGLVSSHFSIGYQRTADFNRRSFIQAYKVPSSLLDEIVYQADGLSPNEMYSFPRIRVMYDSYLIDPLNEDVYDDHGLSTGYYHAFEELDENGQPIWGLPEGLNQKRLITESGSAGEFHIAGGLNFSNKVYIGGLIGIAVENYKRTISHVEVVNTANNNWNYLFNYELNDHLTSSSVGVNLKVGVIYKPVAPVRLGFSFHSPTLYSVDEEAYYKVTPQSGYTEEGSFRSDIQEYSYNFRTPYKANASAAFVISNKGLVSVDYEFTDYDAMRFKDRSTSSADNTSYYNDLNNDLKKFFKPSHSVRLGAEFRPAEVISLRGGFSWTQNPYSSYLQNKTELMTYSFGVGYRMNNMYIDLGYMLRDQDYDYSLYYSGFVADEYQKMAKMKNKDHIVAVTLGWRF